MYFNVSDEDKNKSGVYRIYNKLKDRAYYGSTNDFKQRYKNHLFNLDEYKHRNKFLQHDYKQTGLEHFTFEVLDITTLENQFIVEQIYLDQYWDNQTKCYNFDRHTIKNPRKLFSKNPIETTKKKIESTKRQWQDPKIKQKMWDNRNKANIEKGYKNYTITDDRELKTNEEIIKNQNAILVTRIKTYDENNEDIKKFSNSPATIKECTFIDPKGNVVHTTNLEKLCYENGLKRGPMLKLRRGELPSVFGWRKYDVSLIGVSYISAARHKQKSFRVKSPTGEIFEATNMTDFSFKHNLCKANLSSVIRGIRDSHRGWTRVD